MNPPTIPPLLAWVTFLFSLIQSRDLLVVWRHSPLDRLGWVSLLIWLIPPFFVWQRGGPTGFCKTSGGFLTAAILLLLAGGLFELHALNHLAVALSLTAIARPPGHLWPWLAGSLSWMPILTWVAKDLPSWGLLVMRLVVATTGAVLGYLSLRRTPSHP